MTTVRVERRKRGFFGWVFLLAFWGFNALMALALWAGVSGSVDRMEGLSTDAERAGAVIGTGLGVGMLVSVWAAGSLILGLFVLLTPGRKVITETRKDA